tara:strand:- start:80 stop:718 length:639 start_codon:yes stop_codon:yes gene_type:complete
MTGRKPKDLTGNRFGRLVAVEILERSDHYGRWWLCVCDCGENFEAQAYTLNRGSVTSCGCTKDENRLAALTTHGMTNTPVWHSWRAMKHRCECPTSKDYPRYGGRGIKVLPEWSASFESFYRCVGDRPPGTTLDRIDPNGDYWPGNVRWASNLTQGRNKSRPGGSGSQHPGVRFLSNRGKWIAEQGTSRIGTFNTKEEAIAAKEAWLKSESA